VFTGPSLAVVTRVLAVQIEARLPRLGGCSRGEPASLIASQLAGAQFALMLPWLLAAASADPARLTAIGGSSGI
jgi:hypothetical protein